MTHRTHRVAGALATIALTAGSLGLASTATAADHGTPHKPAPCAQQQKQFDRAEDALARLTAVFEKQKVKVEKAHDRAEAADTEHERNAARKALREAKADRAEAKKDKLAQQQRVAKAEARLASCKAEQDEPAEQGEPAA